MKKKRINVNESASKEVALDGEDHVGKKMFDKESHNHGIILMWMWNKLFLPYDLLLPPSQHRTEVSQPSFPCYLQNDSPYLISCRENLHELLRVSRYYIVDHFRMYKWII